MVFTDFKRARAEAEAEGVYIGGWGIKNAIVPRKHGGTSIDFPSVDLLICSNLVLTKTHRGQPRPC